MDDDTIDEQLPEEVMDTVTDAHAVHEYVDNEPTVLTSAAPPVDDEVSPWPSARSERRFHSMRGAVYSAVGSTRVA